MKQVMVVLVITVVLTVAAAMWYSKVTANNAAKLGLKAPAAETK